MNTPSTITLLHSTNAAHRQECTVVKVGAAHVVVRVNEADVRFAVKTGLRVGGHHTRGVGYDDLLIDPETLRALTGTEPVVSKQLPMAGGETAATEEPAAPAKPARKPRAPKAAKVTDADVEAARVAIETVAAHTPAEEPATEAPAVAETPTPAPVAELPAHVQGCRACYVAQMLDADDAIGGEFFGETEHEARRAQIAAAGPHTCPPATDPNPDPEGLDEPEQPAVAAPAEPEAPAPVSAPETPALTDDPRAMLARAVEHVGRVQDPEARLALAAITDVIAALLAGPVKTVATKRAAAPAAPKAPRVARPVGVITEGSTPAHRATAGLTGETAERCRRLYNGTLWPAWKVAREAGETGLTDAAIASLLTAKLGAAPVAEVLAWAIETTRAYFAAKTGGAPVGERKSTPPAPKAPAAPKTPKAVTLGVGSVVDIRKDLRGSYEDVLGFSQMVGLTIEALAGKNVRARTNTGVTLPKIALADLVPSVG